MAPSDLDHGWTDDPLQRAVHLLISGGPAIAAKVLIVLILSVIAFQLALVFGAPWGELTMGGAFPGRLPPRMRVAAALSALLLLAFGAIVAARAELAFVRWRRISRRLIWVVVAYGAASVVLHVVTPSARERRLWLPVAIVLTSCALVVARGSHSGDRFAAMDPHSERKRPPNA